jgi:Tol biopolymer transport system component
LKGKILFARAGGQFGDETTFTANADGSGEKRVRPLDDGCCPRWAADGRHFLISAAAPNDRVTTGIVDANGSKERDIPLPDKTLNLGPGAWSRDGKRLTFDGWDVAKPGRNGAYMARASDGGDLVRITHSPSGLHDIPLDFAPDGSRILFVRPPQERTEPVGPLFVVNIDGSHLQRITPKGIDAAYTARWSPDAKWIIFSGAYWEVSAGPIWMMHPDGSGLHKLFVDDAGSRAATTPTWSPDGRLILFALTPADGDVHAANELYVIKADGSGLTKVVDTPDCKREPDWVASG